MHWRRRRKGVIPKWTHSEREDDDDEAEEKKFVIECLHVGSRGRKNLSQSGLSVVIVR